MQRGHLIAAIVKCKEFSKRFIYSPRTHNLLNYVTLDIKDKEMKEVLKQFRLEWLDRMWIYVMIL